MSIPVPKNLSYDHAKRLVFMECREPEHTGRYDMRGAICWPVVTELFGKTAVHGFVLVAGRNIETDKIYVFNDRLFSFLETKTDGHKIVCVGIESVFNKAWSLFYCDHYFMGGQDEDVAMKHRLQIHRSHMIQPKPKMFEVAGFDEMQAYATALQMAKTGAIVARKGGDLEQQLAFAHTRDQGLVPGVHAVECLVASYERYQWRGEK